jgi:hypothetical protein
MGSKVSSLSRIYLTPATLTYTLQTIHRYLIQNNPQVSKIMCPPNDDRNMMFTNAEEEVFVGECDLVLNLADEGEGNRSFATAFSQVSLSNIYPAVLTVDFSGAGSLKKI